MKRTFLLLSLCLGLGCATPRPTLKPVDRNAVFDTGIGFKFRPVLSGNWYRMRSPDNTGYILGKEPSAEDKKDGSTVVAEIRFGFLNLKAMKLKSSKDIFTFFERGMVSKTENDRFESVTNDFRSTTFKTADCRTFEQMGYKDKLTLSFKNEKMSMKTRGMMCLHPKDHGRYIRIAVSQRVPISRTFADFKAEEKNLFDTLEFGPLTGPAPK